MYKFSNKIKENFLYRKCLLHYKSIFNVFIVGCLFMLSTHAFATDPAVDILDGTAAGLTATLKGTGKTYLYIAEGVLSLAAYIKTKNLLFLAGIVVVACFFNIMMKVAGVS